MNRNLKQFGNVGLLILLTAIAALVAADLALDAKAGASGWHVLGEGLALTLAMSGAAILIMNLRRSRRAVRDLERDLEVSRADADRWRAEAEDLLRGFGQAIDQQFERWGLTPAEREVGLLLLKGLGHKQIASLRGTSERTVRQQAHAIYRKANLPGRADLAAFFLEGLPLPNTIEKTAPTPRL
jgi:DNA-binding CsgD family transcriptional regulator